MNRMHRNAAPLFERLKAAVIAGAGFDFLAVCGDVLRAADFRSTKDGVANRSWHKTGRAFDYDQTSAAIVIVSEVAGGKQFFRTYLKCKLQDGSQGKLLKVRDMRGHTVSAYLFDFTKAAEDLGWERIPAWNGWKKNYNRREFWHYQFDQGLTWDSAMQQIKGLPAVPTKAAVAAGKLIIGRNDRDSNTGGRVTPIQKALNRLGLLPSKEIDGIYGGKTANAVKAFQRRSGLAVDGDTGPNTLKALGL